MDVSIVIVNYNTRDLIERCINHLKSQSTRYCLEIIVVDNASADGSGEYLAMVEGIIYIPSDKNLGFAGGCNLGMYKSSGDFILLLNTDAFPEQNAIDIMVDYMRQHPDVGVVGAQLYYPNGNWQRSGGFIPSPHSAMLNALGLGSLFNLYLNIISRINPKTSIPIEYVAGACMLIRKAMIDKIGLLSEDYFFYNEDAEFCHRAHSSGWKIRLLLEAHAVHIHGASSTKKNFERSIQLQLQSSKKQIIASSGGFGWKQYCFWMTLNFLWRYSLLGLFVSKNKKLAYLTLCRIYWDEFNADSD